MVRIWTTLSSRKSITSALRIKLFSQGWEDAVSEKRYLVIRNMLLLFWLKIHNKLNITPKNVCSLFKVKNAAKFGAAAVLTFPNPLVDSAEGFSRVYPDMWWMPHDAERMGSTLYKAGDPLTPGYPSKGNIKLLSSDSGHVTNYRLETVYRLGKVIFS